jgi:hypothetical protein
MGAQPVPVPPPLSRGMEIEYKAFARAYEGGGATLSLIATCYYPTSGFTIFFEGNPAPTDFELLEKPPQGVVMDLVTYYMASWTTNQRLEDPPSHVEITDASGVHRVRVEHWR